jgi:hypothetical protein
LTIGGNEFIQMDITATNQANSNHSYYLHSSNGRIKLPVVLNFFTVTVAEAAAALNASFPSQSCLRSAVFRVCTGWRSA